MSHEYTPENTCIVACSGPSLNNVDVYSLGYPVVAISTAIRVIPNPDYWIIADSLNQYHGPEGKKAWNDNSTIKIVPKGKKQNKNKSIVEVDYRGSGRKNEIADTLFVPGYPLIRGPHKTITFAIQWLHIKGFSTLIFAGNDLKANSFEEKYAYNLEEFDKKKRNNFKKTIDDVHFTLNLWYPIAKKKGYEWYSWKCGPVFSSLVPELPDDFKKTTPKAKQLVIEEEETNEIDTNKIAIKIIKEETNKIVNSFKNIDIELWKEKRNAWLQNYQSGNINKLRKATRNESKRVLKLEKYRMENNHE